MEQAMNSHHKNIIILGAGFGGIKCALTLRKLLHKHDRGTKKYSIILIDKEDHHTYIPALYEIATAFKGDADAFRLQKIISVPVSEIAENFHLRFHHDEVANIDLEKKMIYLRDGERLTYEFIVIALGAETNYYNIPGLRENSYPLKTFTDAISVRNAIEDAFCRASDLINIIVGGGGVTGVEFSGELIGYFRRLLKKYQREYGIFNITLIEAGPEILGGFDPEICIAARDRLEKFGIKILTKTRIKKAEKNSVIIEKDGEEKTLPASLIIWTGGVKPASFLEKINLSKDNKGRMLVNEYLEAGENIYALGDNAAFRPESGCEPLPGTAYVAIWEGKAAAENIYNKIIGKHQKRFSCGPLPFNIPIGGRFAIAQFYGWRVIGFWGWVAKHLIELKYLFYLLPNLKAIKIWTRGFWIFAKND